MDQGRAGRSPWALMAAPTWRDRAAWARFEIMMPARDDEHVSP
jgi:hypothetical protein